MTNQEANKIIAEFMGWRKYYDACKVDGKVIYPCDSLDALVPVWEKLGTMPTLFKLPHEKKYGAVIQTDIHSEVNEVSETTQEAAAIATAKAIKEL